MGRRAGRISAGRTRRGAEGRRCVVNGSRPAESKKDDCGRYWRVLQSRLFIYAPKIVLLSDMQKTLLKKMGKKMKKTPRVSAETRGVRESGADGAHRPTAAGCVFRAVGSARAQRRGRCRVGAVRCGCVFQQRRRQGGGQARSEGAMRRGSRRRKPPRGVFFSRGWRGARQGRCGWPRGAAGRSTRLGRLCGH